MKAIRVEAPGGPDVLSYEDVPDPTPDEGEALVRIEAVGVNFTEVYSRRERGPFPHIAGVEAAGVVEALGPGVTSVQEGDRVAYTGAPGAYAERAAVPAQRLVPLPDGLTSKIAAAVLLQGMTAHYLACSTYPLRPEDTCLVHAAAGGVGLLLCAIAKQRGARVIGTVSTEEKAQAAREAGADDVILYTQTDFAEEAKRLTEGRGVDVIYDSVGKTTFLKGFDCLRPRGMMVQYGSASGEAEPVDTAFLNAKGSIYLTRTNLGTYTATREELLERSGEVFAWVADGRLPVRIFEEYPLRDAAKAHAALEQRETIGKLILTP